MGAGGGGVKLIVPKQTSEHSYLNKPDVNYSKALMLHPEQQHLKLTISSACIATYPIHALVSSCRSHCNAPLWCGHTSCYPTVLHSCWHLLDCLHWPYRPLCMSLGFCFPCSSSFLKASPAHLQNSSSNTSVFKCELTYDTANASYSENKSRILVLEGGQFLMMATRHILTWRQLRLKEFQDKTVLTGLGGVKLSAKIKAINCCVYSTSVSTWCARAYLFKAC